MDKTLKFFACLFSDGFKLVGVLAPFLSLLFTLAKFFGFDGGLKTYLQDLSYGWAFLPLFIWTFVAYVRRFLIFNRLENPVNSTTVNNYINNYAHNGAPTFLEFRMNGHIEVVQSNNVTGISDNGFNVFGVIFTRPIVESYYVEVKCDGVCEFGVSGKTQNGFQIQFQRCPPKSGKIMVLK